MAIHFIPIVVKIGSWAGRGLTSLGSALKDLTYGSRKILVVLGVLTAAGFSLSYFLREIVDSFLRLWPLLVLVLIFLLLREFVRRYFKVERKKAERGGDL